MQSASSSNTETTNETSRQQTPAQVTEVLKLRLIPKRKKKKKAVSWAEDVVDNENMDKKSSKKCCIFHKQRQFGDWGSDSDCSDSESCPNCEQDNAS